MLTPMSELLIQYFPTVLPLFCFPHIIIKRCTFYAWSTSSHFTEILEARLNSLSAIKVIIRKNEETIFLRRTKFSQWYIKALDFGKVSLSVKYVMVFKTWGSSREQEQEQTIWTINCIWWSKPQIMILGVGNNEDIWNTRQMFCLDMYCRHC